MIDHKQHIKVEKNDFMKQLEQDKCPKHDPAFLQQHREELERLKQKERNKHFDPNYMEINLPDSGNNINNPILDPEFMVIDIK